VPHRRDSTLGGSKDGAAWRYLDGGHTSAEEDHESFTMGGAKHARVLGKGFDDFFDDVLLIHRMVFMSDVELVTAHESDS